jgi:hypothetical protein
MPTATPIPSARTTAADKCSGTAKNKAFFVEVAANVAFDVYCVVLPSDWRINWGAYVLEDGGRMTVEYKNTRGFYLVLEEGSRCYGECYPCSIPWCSGFPGDEHIWLGDLGAYLLLSGKARTYIPPDNYWEAFAPVGSYIIYTLEGGGMSKATFLKIAAGMVKVSKS